MITGTWTAACMLLAAAAGAPTSLPPDVCAVKSAKFEIPIKVDPERKQEIRALELYVSTNQGRNWEMVGAASPAQSGFQFTAPVDGLYWFTVQTTDVQGRKEPPDGKMTPG